MSDAVLYCRDLDQSIAVFTRLGLRLDTIAPADDPCTALLSGGGQRVRLVRLGTVDLDRAATPALRPAFVVARADDSSWRTGRAGMRYRDLIPDRQGGRYIASHIRIDEGGPVPDYVHFHAVELQVIYCHKGWVRVVYEDQGEPFLMHAGDCVLQPPGIRHRVLEASPGLEVVEVGAPAVHATHVEHELALPTLAQPGRTYGGQRFVHHRPAEARFVSAPIAGLDACDLGIAAASSGRVAVHRLAAREPGEAPGRRVYVHDAELLFHIVLRGELTLDDEHRLGPADAFVVPAGRPFAWSDGSPDLALLQVVVPGARGIRCIAG